MKVGYVINTGISKKHLEYITLLKEYSRDLGENIVVDMADKKPLHEIFWEIRDAKVDLWITLDSAGFELRTENDTLSLNNVYARMAHILFKPLREYRFFLKEQLNFSMFTYVVNKQDMELIQKSYPNIPNIGLFPKIEQNEVMKRQLVKEWFEQLLELCEL